MARHNIMLVDSEMLSRELLTNHLKHEKFIVFAAENCTQAKKLIQANRFRLAIINSRLGDKETGELTARLRSVEKDALIYLLVAQPLAYDAENLSQRGLHDTIVKPFRLEEIKIKLRHGVELLSLRDAVRKLSARLDRANTRLESCRMIEEVEEQVKIPDLSGLETEDNLTSERDERGREKAQNKKKSAVKNPWMVPGRPNQADQELDSIEKIRRLDILRKAGILTKKEFDNKKKELLKRI